jgi:MFS transporter, SP family, general alpha glucoside:H+ symporter
MTGFPYAGLAAGLAVFMFFMLPETKGRTYAELDILFENRVSARKFHKTSVDSFAGHNTELRFDGDANSDNTSERQEKGFTGQREVV